MKNILSLSPFLNAESPPGFILLIAPHAGAEALMQAIAAAVIERPINVLDAGLRFDVHRVARLVRLQSPRVYEALRRIQLVRVFNACQLVDGLHAFDQDRFPILIFGALALFESDTLTSQRERMLFNDYLATLRRYSQERTLILSLKPAPRLQTPPWNQLLQSATRFYDLSLTEISPATQQPDLFGGTYG